MRKRLIQKQLKSCYKDLKNLPKNIQEKIKKLVFEEIPNKNSLSEIPNVKKLKGVDSYYRIRVGEYRIGFKYENGKIVFYRVLPLIVAKKAPPFRAVMNSDKNLTV